MSSLSDGVGHAVMTCAVGDCAVGDGTFVGVGKLAVRTGVEGVWELKNKVSMYVDILLLGFEYLYICTLDQRTAFH